MRPEDLEESFDKLGIPDENGEIVIERSELLDLLQERGEHLRYGIDFQHTTNLHLSAVIFDLSSKSVDD